MDRRAFLQSALVASAVSSLAAPLSWAGEKKKPRRLLLRSSWQTVNIGDIGHTPGMLRLLEQHLPEVEVTLWPSNVDRGVDKMLLKAFPWLRIAEGRINAEGKPSTPELREAFQTSDFLLHGSGPSVVAHTHLAAWRKATGKPYGILGVTIGDVSDKLRELLSAADFVYCRDTISLAGIKAGGVESPVMEFGPDATFAFHLRDEARAEKFLAEQGLKEREFLCVIPRLRYTPYHQIHNRPETDQTRERDAYNAEHRDKDHAKQRDVICAWVRETGKKVVACAEMTYQVPLAKELLLDPLPDDVKPHVVWRDSYWLPDEAASVYKRAHTLVSFEMHSPIISAAAGTPAFYLRQPTDTSKGQMWRDIGLQEWIFEIDESTGDEIAQRVLSVHADYEAAQQKLAKAMDFVHQRCAAGMASVKKSLA